MSKMKISFSLNVVKITLGTKTIWRQATLLHLSKSNFMPKNGGKYENFSDRRVDGLTDGAGFIRTPEGVLKSYNKSFHTNSPSAR